MIPRKSPRWQAGHPDLLKSRSFDGVLNTVPELQHLRPGQALLVPARKRITIYHEAKLAGWPKGSCRAEWNHKLDGYVVEKIT